MVQRFLQLMSEESRKRPEARRSAEHFHGRCSIVLTKGNSVTVLASAALHLTAETPTSQIRDVSTFPESGSQSFLYSRYDQSTLGGVIDP